MNIKIIPHTFLTVDGKIVHQYGVIIEGEPRKIFNSKEELEAFLKRVNEN